MDDIMNKTTQIAARIKETERNELTEIATTLDVPESQIIREAVREKIAQLKETHPKLRGQDTEIGVDK
jgi:hypothetical protein